MNTLAGLAKREWLLFFLVAVGWQAAFTIAGFLVGDGQLLTHTMSWDAGWYEAILKGGYFDNPSAPVFYPLFPLIVWTLQQVTFHLFSFATLGVIINTFALWLALVALYRIAHKLVAGREWLVVLLFLASPAAFFMHMFYTEALFCAIAFWAYWFALDRQWLRMALLLALLTATRLPALLFIGLCALEYLRAHQWYIGKALRDKNVLVFLIAPLGFIAYGLFLHIIHGDFLGMFHAYQAEQIWTYQSFNPNILSPVYEAAVSSMYIVLGKGGQAVNTMVPLFSLAALGAASVYAVVVRRKNQALLPLGLFGLAAIIMFTINDNLVSGHRYVLPCLVIYIAAAYVYLQNQWTTLLVWAFVFICFAQQIMLFLLFTGSRFAG